MKERTLQPALAGLCQGLAYSGKIDNDRRVSSEAVWSDHYAGSVSAGMALAAALFGSPVAAGVVRARR